MCEGYRSTSLNIAFVNLLTRYNIAIDIKSVKFSNRELIAFTGKGLKLIEICVERVNCENTSFLISYNLMTPLLQRIICLRLDN